MSVTSFIGQCFHNGVWGFCSRKPNVNKYVQKATTRKWKYRDGKDDDEADGVVDVGDLAELEYSIVDQQPNAIVLKIDDNDTPRQESIDEQVTKGSVVSTLLLNANEDQDEEEINTSPSVLNEIEAQSPRSSISATNVDSAETPTENDLEMSANEIIEQQKITNKEDQEVEENCTQNENSNQEEIPLTNGHVSTQLKKDINENTVDDEVTSNDLTDQNSNSFEILKGQCDFENEASNMSSNRITSVQEMDKAPSELEPGSEIDEDLSLR